MSEKKNDEMLDIDTNVPEEYAQQQIIACFTEYTAYLIIGDDKR